MMMPISDKSELSMMMMLIKDKNELSMMMKQRYLSYRCYAGADAADNTDDD